MMKIVLTPEAANDLELLKDYLDLNYGENDEKRILKSIISDIKRLIKYPETDIKLFDRFDIVTDYKCMYTNNNYVFYRIEDKTIRIIRILSVKRDFLYILLGTKMTSDESDDYWKDK